MVNICIDLKKMAQDNKKIKKGRVILNNNQFEKLKEKYKEGFRCIRSDESNGELTVHLKNFYNEKIDSLKSDNPEEIRQILDYIQSVTEEEFQ